MNRMTLAAITAAFLTTAAMPAFAAEAQPLRVKIADLDLSTAEGLKAAHKRVTSAATRYCTVVETGSRIGVLDTECKDALVAKAKSELDLVVASVKAGETQRAELTLKVRRAT